MMTAGVYPRFPLGFIEPAVALSPPVLLIKMLTLNHPPTYIGEQLEVGSLSRK